MANQAPFGAIVQAGAGTTHLITGVSGQKFRILGLAGAIGTTGTMQLKSSGGTAITGAINLSAGQPLSMDAITIEGGEGWGETQPGEGLDIVTQTGAFNGVFTGQWMPA